jgi:hypothetical protein
VRPRTAAAVSVILLLSSAPGSGRAHAQQPPRLSGYLEHQYSASRTVGGWSQLDYDRLRLDLAAVAGRSARVEAAVVWQLYRGNTSVRIRDLLPEVYRPLAPTTAVVIEDHYYLNHLYAVIPAGAFDLTVGKQYLAWGKAMAFNPTELFRPKNLLEPTYEREGVGALALRLTTGALGDVQAVLVPDGSFETSAKVLRVRQHLAGFDISALAAELHQGVGTSYLGGSAGPRRRRVTLGGDLSGELLGLGVWLEGTWSSHEGEEWVELTLGGNCTLPTGTLFTLEGYYDGRGKWTPPYPLTSWLGRLTGARRTLGRGMVFGMLSHSGERWTPGLAGVGNTGDRSVVLIPNLAYGFAQDVDFIFNAYLPLGPDGSEFGTSGGGGFLRLRVYF